MFNAYFFAIATLFFQPQAPVSVDLEYAVTPEVRAWGLMQRYNLPANYGMVFPYSEPTHARLWMFNCFTDLSVAFLDKDRVIREIRELKAYPEKMDPRRPVYQLNDISKYSTNDPIIRFFNERAVESSFRASYAVEMGAGAFFNQKVQVGDVFHWSESNSQAQILRTINLNQFERPSLIQLSKKVPISVWASGSSKSYQVTFLDKDKFVLQSGKIAPLSKTVLISAQPVSFIKIE